MAVAGIQAHDLLRQLSSVLHQDTKGPDNYDNTALSSTNFTTLLIFCTDDRYDQSLSAHESNAHYPYCTACLGHLVKT